MRHLGTTIWNGFLIIIGGIVELITTIRQRSEKYLNRVNLAYDIILVVLLGIGLLFYVLNTRSWQACMYFPKFKPAQEISISEKRCWDFSEREIRSGTNMYLSICVLVGPQSLKWPIDLFPAPLYSRSLEVRLSPQQQNSLLITNKK